MKSKKLLLSTLVGFGCLASYLIFSSNSGGIMGASTTGCGGNGCHGSQNAATGISITGIPATGFLPGTNYPVTLSVTVANATLTAAGFDMTVSTGTLSNAPANTMLMGGTELHHTAPKALMANTVSWSFNWTAPAAGTPSVNFNISANAVNQNNNSNGDQWNKTTITINAAAPTSVESVAPDAAPAVYPNPASDRLSLRFGREVQVQHIRAVSLTGSVLQLNATALSAAEYELNISSLAAGQYILLAEANGKTIHTTFLKK